MTQARIMWGIALCFAAFASTPSRASAQDVGPLPHHHSPVAAGVIEWFLPTAGFAYAGDWSRGMLPNVVRIGAWVGLLATSNNPDDSCEGSCQIWGTAVIGATIWSVIGAVRTAGDHNAGNRDTASRFFIGPDSQGGLSVGVLMPW